MPIKVRVVQKPNDSFAVERETAEGSKTFQQLKAFTEDQDDKARKYADRQYLKLNRGDNAPVDTVVYELG